VSLTIRIALASALPFIPLVPSGCSEPAPATIEGKAPADYREEMEKKISRPLGDPPVKSPGPKAQGRR
jgi:hypothetical protein